MDKILGSRKCFHCPTFILGLILATILPWTGGGAISSDRLLPRTPYIELPLQRNLTVAVGSTALLRCPVKNLGDKTVSWIRRRDLHILTSGNHIFTSDPRVSLLRERGTWTLRLERAQRKDDSPYECQINTEPKTRLAIFLTVVASQNDEWVVPPLEAQVDYRLRGKSELGIAQILGPSRLSVSPGSTLDLTCLASHSHVAPEVVTWYHNGQPIRNGMTLMATNNSTSTLSKLRLSPVQPSDFGRFSCGGPGLETLSGVLLSVDRDLEDVPRTTTLSPVSHSGTQPKYKRGTGVISNLAIANFFYIIHLL